MSNPFQAAFLEPKEVWKNTIVESYGSTPGYLHPQNIFLLFCENVCDARSCEVILSSTRRKKELAENPGQRLWWNKRIRVSSGLMWGHFTLREEVPCLSARNAAFTVLGGTLILLCVWHWDM